MSATSNHRRPPLSLYPTLIWFLVFLVIPVFIVFTFSLMHKGTYGQVIYQLDTGNFARVFQALYLKIFVRSLWLASYTTVICLALAYPVSYLMARSPAKLKNLLLALIIIPFWTNFVIRVYALKLILPARFLDNEIGTCIGMIYNYLPFMILPLFVSLEKLDFTLLDAAYDLGANRFQMLLRVLFPLSLPGLLTGGLFVFIPAFGEFVIPELLGGSQSMYIGNLITETFLKSRDWPFGSALSTFLVGLAMFAFFISIRKASKKSGEKEANAHSF